MNCRFCKEELNHKFVFLGSSPLSNAFISEVQLSLKEAVYPLEAYVCSRCFLVQLAEFESPQNIFSEYLYFSSFSDVWLNHAKDYVEKMSSSLKLNSSSLVVEIASNDGYLLQYFIKKNVKVLGIEPAKNVAEVARRKGIPTETIFFGEDSARKLASQGKSADLLLGNNVLAHVPELNDFVAGLKILLKPDGLITMEFPHLEKLIENVQFDTIYHEHFSYFSLLTVEKVFSAHGLIIYDVEELETHGGSLRIYAKHKEDKSAIVSSKINNLREREVSAGFKDINFYLAFQKKVETLKDEITNFLITEKRKGKSFVGYGAPAKGNTLLNYCGIKSDIIKFTVDRNPNKQGKYLPGSRIPIKSPEEIQRAKPDYVIIFPWNIKGEVMEQQSIIRSWGGKFVVFIPKVVVL